MLSVPVAIFAKCAIYVGLGFILSRTMPSMPQNKIIRFAFLFVVWVPMNFVINYINVRGLEYHKMSWTGAFVIALILATYGTFLPSQRYNSNTP